MTILEEQVPEYPDHYIFIRHGDYKVIVDGFSTEDIQAIADQVFLEQFFGIGAK